MWFVIGVSGATCSGKSTLAHKLHQIFQGSLLVCQDDYFLPKESVLHTWLPILNHINWEIPSSIDMSKMKAEIHKILGSEPDIFTKNNGTGDAHNIKNNPTKYVDHRSHLGEPNCPKILILEGFLIFGDIDLTSLCNLKYFLTLSKEECWKRRSVRTYDPPDVPGYFDQCVWPEYEKHRDSVFTNVTDIVFLDGTTDKSQLLHRILQDIVQLCPSLRIIINEASALQ